MVRSLLSLCLLLLSGLLMAQGVGINNPTPHASALLDLTSTDKGLLVPRMTTAQRDGIPLPATSLLVYNTTNARFEFFNGSAWVPLVVSGGTLDQAYDFGGAGAGRSITADAGAVTIAGTDGLVSRGTLGNGATAPPGVMGNGVIMLWNPRKAAFRAGGPYFADPTTWNDEFIGQYSTAFGHGSRASGRRSMAWGTARADSLDATAWGHSTASGERSTAWGYLSQATGKESTAWGSESIASGHLATAWGGYSQALELLSTAWGGATASGQVSTAWGQANAMGFLSTAWGQGMADGGSSTAWGLGYASGGVSTAWNSGTASGTRATAWGMGTHSRSHSETSLGIGPTGYTPSVNGATQFRAANAADRLLVVGNAIDLNNNDILDASERSNAFLILKNGNTAIGNIDPTTKLDVDGQVRIRGGNPAAGRVMMGDATGLATWVDPTTTASGTLDQAYDFGGPGAGRTIVADAGAVTIAGNDGVVSTGTLGNGAVAPSGIGVRLVWNPRKAAFRAGSAGALSWNDANIGSASAAFGNNTTASGGTSTAFGLSTTASGGISTAFGQSNTASSYGETAFGIGSTTYTPSVNGDIQFQTGNSTDRLLVVGNAIDANANFQIDPAERSNAFLILKNGNTAIGNANPNTRLDVVAGTTGATSRVLTVRSNFSTNNTGTGIALINSTSNTSNVGSEISSVTTNASTGLSDLRFHVHGGGTFGALDERMRILGNGNVGIGTNTPTRRLHVANGTSGATSNANTALLVEGEAATYQHFLTPSTAESGLLYGTEVGSIRGGIFFNNTNATDGMQFRTGGNATRMTLTSAGNLGIGTNTPARRLHVSTGASGATSIANAAVVVEGGGATYQHYLVPSSAESGLLFGTEVGSVRSGIIFNNTNVSEGLQFRTGGNNTRMSITDAGLVGIGTTAPATRLQVNGGIAVTPPAVVSATTLPFIYNAGDRSYIRMGSNGTPANRVVVLDNGLSVGQILVVECTATGSNGIRFQNAGNMSVSGLRDLLIEDTITFIWNGTKWLEISYSNN